MIVALSAGLALGGCHAPGPGNNAVEAAAATEAANVTAATDAGPATPDASTKRAPGSWSTNIEVGRLEGKDVKPGMREQLQSRFNMMGAVSACVTPEMAAREDVSAILQDSASSRKCTFDKREVSGSAVDFSAVCDRAGKQVRMHAKGTVAATLQDMVITVEQLDAKGRRKGIMEMHMTSKRNGACRPDDLRPPTTAPKKGPKP